MRLTHFERFQPVCPSCLALGQTPAPLIIGAVFSEDQAGISQGVLHCPELACQQEYPIIDGIPIIVADIPTLLNHQIHAIERRADLAPELEGMLGDALGDTASWNVWRQHLSIYGWDSYGEFLEDEHEPSLDPPGAVVRCLEQGLAMLEPLAGPVIDLGCSVGRTTFELAGKVSEPVLGIDLNFSMLQLAQRLLREGRATIPLRQAGLVYESRTIETPFAGTENVDFWLCDAIALPFNTGSAATITALNLLDCVPSPLALLHNVERVLSAGGQALIGCPYDWASGATAPEQWIGGHSQRGPFGGSPERLLAALLSPDQHPQSLSDLAMIAELSSVPWQTRLHARSTNRFLLHMVAARKSAQLNEVS